MFSYARQSVHQLPKPISPISGQANAPILLEKGFRSLSNDQDVAGLLFETIHPNLP